MFSGKTDDYAFLYNINSLVAQAQGTYDAVFKTLIEMDISSLPFADYGFIAIRKDCLVLDKLHFKKASIVSIALSKMDHLLSTEIGY